MLTPFFELSQTDNEVFLVIKAPLANVSNAELTVNGDTIIFYCSPYYLRLHLPGQVIENEADEGKYNCDNQEFLFSFLKANKNEHFPDLDMIGKLLVPKKKHTIKPVIEDCSPAEGAPDSESDDDSLGYIRQEIINSNASCAKFGFANKGQGIGNHLSSEFNEILDFTDFENTSTDERSVLREADEQSKFSEDHYLADLMEGCDEINGLVYWKPAWVDYTDDKVKFSREEIELFKTLGNRDYLLDEWEKKTALFSLVDILFAFAYNHRTTLGEYSVESAWTINKLSATLSWFQSFKTLKEVKVACIRRSLVFPLYRHWELTQEVIRDTVNILKSGRRQVLKCIIAIYKMFNSSEPRYLLNELYITDYCIWVQKISEKKIKKLGDLFEKEEVSKSDIGFELEELEAAALMVQEETESELADQLKEMKIKENNDGTSESDTDSSSSESSASTSLDSDDLSSSEE